MMDADKKPSRKKRNLPLLPLVDGAEPGEDAQPALLVQSPKTPTLSRKLKAVSLDSDAGQKKSLEVSRDVSSVPNTPKKQLRKEVPQLGSNLKRFASNQSISGSQTLKTLPEIMTLQDFSGARAEPVRIKAKGLLERRGSNASLTIDLGSNSNLCEPRPPPVARLNTAKSVSNLNLTSFGFEKCFCAHRCRPPPPVQQPPGHQPEQCGNCTIYESVPSGRRAARHDAPCKCSLKFLPRYYIERHCVCNLKYRRKSLSNENLYVPPCNFCHFGAKDCYTGGRTCNRGARKALYPRQTYIETSQLLSEDFKLHLQNIQYLQTAGSVLSVAELKQCCQVEKLARLHQEFWEIPLNLQEKCLVSGSQSRNRYKGVLPNEHSRVHLPEPQSYIHANFIKGADYTETAYIATQGPMSHTCEDFWSMVWCNKVKCIVMLTALVERGRSKCELYFPLGAENAPATVTAVTRTKRHATAMNDSSDDEAADAEDVEASDVMRHGAFTVRYVGREQLGECVVRTLELERTDPDVVPPYTESRRLSHYWYANWADHKQANPEQVLHIALHVLGLTNSKTSSVSDSNSSFDVTFDSASSGAEPSAAAASPDACFADEPPPTEGETERNVPFTAHKSCKRSVVSLDEASGGPGSRQPKFDFDAALAAQTAVAETASPDSASKKHKNDGRITSDGKQPVEGAAPFQCELDAKPPKLTLDKSKLAFDNLAKVIEKHGRNPTVVHCSAGIGRTGCFLAVLNGIQQLQMNYNVDVLAIVCSLRLNRGGMVQTAEQYELVHRVLSLYADLL